MFTQFAKLLGIPTRAAEDALHSEKLAQAHLMSRRALLGGSLALLTPKHYSIPSGISAAPKTLERLTLLPGVESTIRLIGYTVYEVYTGPILPIHFLERANQAERRVDRIASIGVPSNQSS